MLPVDTYRRLAADLTGGGYPGGGGPVGGGCLTAALEGGVAVLKVSHDDLVRDGHAGSADPDELRAVMGELARSGAETVIVSRAEQPALALVGDRAAEIRTPRFTMLDHRGAGDSMTAGVAAALARGADMDQALRLGAAAGALNTTRHGLATGERDLIERLAARVDICPISDDVTR